MMVSRPFLDIPKVYYSSMHKTKSDMAQERVVGLNHNGNPILVISDFEASTPHVKPISAFIWKGINFLINGSFFDCLFKFEFCVIKCGFENTHVIIKDWLRAWNVLTFLGSIINIMRGEQCDHFNELENLCLDNEWDIHMKLWRDDFGEAIISH